LLKKLLLIASLLGFVVHSNANEFTKPKLSLPTFDLIHKLIPEENAMLVSKGGVFKQIDLATWDVMKSWDYTSKCTAHIRMSHDRKTIACKYGEDLCIFDVESSAYKQIDGVFKDADKMELAPDGKQVIMFDAKLSPAIIYDVKTPMKKHPLAQKNNTFSFKAWSPDSNYIAYATDRGVLVIKELSTGKELRPYKKAKRFFSSAKVLFTHDASKVLYSDDRKTLMVFDIHTDTNILSIDHPGWKIEDFVLSPNDKKLIVVFKRKKAYQSRVVIYDFKTGKELHSWPIELSTCLQAIDENRILVCDRSAEIRKIDTGEIVTRSSYLNRFKYLAFLDTSHTLVLSHETARSEPRLYTFNIEKGELLPYFFQPVYTTRDEGYSFMVFQHKDIAGVLERGSDKLHLYQASTKKHILTFSKIVSHDLSQFTFSEDGQKLYAVEQDKLNQKSIVEIDIKHGFISNKLALKEQSFDLNTLNSTENQVVVGFYNETILWNTKENTVKKIALDDACQYVVNSKTSDGKYLSYEAFCGYKYRKTAYGIMDISTQKTVTRFQKDFFQILPIQKTHQALIVFYQGKRHQHDTKLVVEQLDLFSGKTVENSMHLEIDNKTKIMRLSDDGKYLVTASDEKLEVWNLATQKRQGTLTIVDPLTWTWEQSGGKITTKGNY